MNQPMDPSCFPSCFLSWYRGKKVLVTGHTGFKGSWLCAALSLSGAEVTGYALNPPGEPSLFELSGMAGRMRDVRGDIRDFGALKKVFEQTQPEIVLHLAAQPIVRLSYEEPRYTYETNVMGTVNVLECVRLTGSVRSFLNVTTDKVYLNREQDKGYREEDPLDGFDPYSNSKSCSELVTHSYKNSFFHFRGAPAISTARAGNVIGGGDFARDRIIPDCIRAALAGQPIRLRNPHSIRPYQHVLEPVMAYLMLARAQMEDPEKAGWYNVGPDEENCVTTGTLADLFVRSWGEGSSWLSEAEANAVHEASYLKLDSTRIRESIPWKPVWSVEKAVQETVKWTRAWQRGENVFREMEREIQLYVSDWKAENGKAL